MKINCPGCKRFEGGERMNEALTITSNKLIDNIRTQIWKLFGAINKNTKLYKHGYIHFMGKKYELEDIMIVKKDFGENLKARVVGE